MRRLLTRLLDAIDYPYIWLIASYLAGAYFFGGALGQKIVLFILALIVLWCVIHFLDWLIFDPLIHRIAEREARKEKERLHELSPRFK